jgi:hypothetical protein
MPRTISGAVKVNRAIQALGSKIQASISKHLVIIVSSLEWRMTERYSKGVTAVM